MTDQKWWEQERYELFDIKNTESGIIVLCGRETDDGWEYAAVSYCHQISHLLCSFKNGVRLETANSNDRVSFDGIYEILRGVGLVE